MAKQAAKREARKIVYSSPKKRIEEHEKGWTPTAFRVPEGMPLFKFKKEGTYRLTILGYIVSDGNPFADPGEFHYERTYYTHPDIGPEQQTYVCLQKTFGEPCPQCQAAAILQRQGGTDKDTINALRPKERQFWLLIDHAEREKGVQLMECAHYGKGTGFGEMLDNKLDAADEDSPYQRFFHLGMDGMTLVVKTKSDSFLGRTFYKPSNMELEPRRPNEAVPETILEELPCLDDLIIKTEYDDFRELMEGGNRPAATKAAPKAEAPAAEEPTEPEAEEVEELEDGDMVDLEVGCRVEFMVKGEQVEGEVKEIVDDEKAKVYVESKKKTYLAKIEDLAITQAAPTGDDDGGVTQDDDETGGDVGEGGEDDGQDESEGTEEGEGEDGEPGGEDEEGGEEDATADDVSDDDIPFDADDEAPVDDEPELPPPPPPKPAAKKPSPAPAKKPAPKPAPAKKPASKK